MSIRVLVDSSSPDIQYAGDWISAAPTDDMKNLTKFGGHYVFSDKLYGAPEGKRVSLFYNFTGAVNLRVQGTVDSPRANPAAWNQLCNVEPRGSMVVTETFLMAWGHENDNLLCDVRNLTPEQTYTLNFTVDVTRGAPVWFDRLVTEPAAKTNLDSALVQMDHRHLSIHYDGEWDTTGNAAHSTTEPGAKVSLNFTGTSVTWYSAWHQAWGNRASQASWRIDDGQHQAFTIPTIDSAYENLFIRDPLFKTPELDPGHHRLQVTYNSENSGDRPLALAHLVIQNAPAGDSSSSTNSSSTGTPVVAVTTGSSSGLSQGAKIGVGVGVGLGGLLLIALLTLLFVRRRRTPKKNPLQLRREDTIHSDKMVDVKLSCTPHTNGEGR